MRRWDPPGGGRWGEGASASSLALKWKTTKYNIKYYIW